MSQTPQAYLDCRATVIRHMRQQAGITQERLARIIGVHREAITEIEMGRRDLSLFEAALLCPALDVTLEDLVGDPLIGTPAPSEDK